MVNFDKNISNLLYVLSLKGNIYKVNSFKFYSNSNKKYCVKYQILKRKYNTIKEEKYVVVYECYSKIDLMKFLISEVQEGDAGGKYS